jgi:ribonucleoside-diphosphate reductase alpha chain
MTWSPQGLGLEIFNQRYTRFDGETWPQACYRTADHVARAEDNGKYEKYRERFEQELVENRFMPGGRTWYGAGRPKAQLLNCFVVPTADSREGWGKTISDVIVVSGTGGGVGINLSPVRPRGSDIKGTGGKSTGSVSLMQMIDRVGDILVSGGGRRLALMLCLDVTHPDVEEFLNVKLDLKQLNNANISIVLNMDTAEFVRAVQEDTNIDLSFGGRNNGSSVRAKSLWETIVKNAWTSGEPGVLNGYEANRQNNIWYHKPLVSTNPCGEIWLEEYGCCCLGALVLPRFVSGGQMDWDQLDQTIRLGVRFLDDVLSVNHYPLAEIKDNCEKVRRIGLGVMGLHTMLLELGFKYSSPEAQTFVDTLFSFIKNTAYDSSINLAIEKGPFPAYDSRYLDSGFIKTLKRGIRNKIKEYGIRNCASLTIAPTGTTGMVAGVSTGIEPLFAPVYWRHYKVLTEDGTDTRLEKELVVTPEFEKFGRLAEGAYDIAVRDHFEIQKIVQRHIDNAVSKTINLPKNYPVEDLAALWLEYLPYFKGSTFYREGSRGNEPLEYIPMRLAKAMIDKHEKGVITPRLFETYADDGVVKVVHEDNPIDRAIYDCADGSCEIPYMKESAVAVGV